MDFKQGDTEASPRPEKPVSGVHGTSPAARAHSPEFDSFRCLVEFRRFRMISWRGEAAEAVTRNMELEAGGLGSNLALLVTNRVVQGSFVLSLNLTSSHAGWRW